MGNFIKVSIEPKHQFSDPGDAVFAMSETPIGASDVVSSTVSPNFRNFIVTPNDSYVSGMWTVLGKWTSETGDGLTNGYESPGRFAGGGTALSAGCGLRGYAV